jgi:hypothetical protein
MGHDRHSKDESVEQWLARKEKRRLERLSPEFGRLKRSSLKPASNKRKKKLVEYKKASAEYLQDNSSCELCGCTNNLSIHHVAKRGSNLSNKDKFMTLCILGDYMDKQYPDSNHSHSGGCHGWVEGNKSLSRKLGYLD